VKMISLDMKIYMLVVKAPRVEIFSKGMLGH
jgi:hypothetical protein